MALVERGVTMLYLTCDYTEVQGPPTKFVITNLHDNSEIAKVSVDHYASLAKAYAAVGEILDALNQPIYASSSIDYLFMDGLLKE
jgi:hypothetical protein